MPVSPRRQAELRAQKKRLQDPKKLPRKHCKNCNKLFPLTKPTREFCCNNCRKEFHANGGNAFGPLKTRLEKLVRGITRGFEGKLGVLECLVQNLREAVSMLQREAAASQPPNQSNPVPSATLDRRPQR